MRVDHTIVVTNAGVEIQLCLDHLAVPVGDRSFQNVVILNTHILGGGVERHLDVLMLVKFERTGV